MAEPPQESGSASNKAAAALSVEDRIGLYRTMTLIREFEEQVHRAYLEDLVHGTTHFVQWTRGRLRRSRQGAA
jgi:TPP-dependent pyruvate/acetoin dehydrogenase alpha subunit